MLVGLGLLPAELRLKVKAFEVLAFLPRFLTRRHKDISTAVKADLKRRLTWIACGQVLAALDPLEMSDYGYRHVLFGLLNHVGARVLLLCFQTQCHGLFCAMLL